MLEEVFILEALGKQEQEVECKPLFQLLQVRFLLLLWGEQAETVNTTVAEAEAVDLPEFLTLTETIWYLQVEVVELPEMKDALK